MHSKRPHSCSSHACRSGTRRPRATVFSLVLLATVATVVSVSAWASGGDPAGAASRASVEVERRSNPGGNHPVAAVDAYLAGHEAWKNGDVAAAEAAWKQSAALDLNFLPVRLQLLQYYGVRNFQSFADTFRECLEIIVRDFSAQRWVFANGLVGLCLALTLAAIGVAAGLVIRHFRALHHTMMETLSYALRLDRGLFVGGLALGLLLVPFLANLGLLVTGMFLLFLASYRFKRAERILALSAGAWALLVGPLLLATSPWWSPRTDGRDAVLLSEAQQAPTSPAYHRRVEDWILRGEKIGAALYLEGLASKVGGDGERASKFFRRAAGSGEIPPWVLETNIGNALLMAGDLQSALRHYDRAIALEGAAFEPHYNLALAHASEGRYLNADIEFDRAGRLNLDRLRALSRRSDRFDPSTPVDALWSAADLWSWTLRNPAKAVTPAPLEAVLPLRSLTWTTPLALAAIFFGIVCGRWLRRLIHVHVCYHCGRPVCRRCLVRLERRAYCSGCAESLGGMSSGDATRLLLRRLLDEKPDWSKQITAYAVDFVPGIGALVTGNPWLGFFTLGMAGAGLACVIYPSWGQPLGIGLWEDSLARLVQTLGWSLFLGAGLLTGVGVRTASRRRSNLKTFFSRDVDRLAA